MNRKGKRLKGGMCPPCLMAGGVASGKLMLGAAVGLTGATVLKSKKNSLKKRSRRNKKYKTNIKKRTNKNKISKRKTRRKKNRKK